MDNPFAKLFLENQLCFPLYAASRLSTQIYGPFLNTLGITYPQYLVLLVLWQHNEQTVNEIGNRLLLESNTLTPLLKRLEQKGLIARKRSSADERSVIISLTERGDQMKATAVLIPDKITEAFAGSDITEAEIRAFKATLLKLVEVLNEKISAGNN